MHGTDLQSRSDVDSYIWAAGMKVGLGGLSRWGSHVGRNALPTRWNSVLASARTIRSSGKSSVHRNEGPSELQPCLTARKLLFRQFRTISPLSALTVLTNGAVRCQVDRLMGLSINIAAGRRPPWSWGAAGFSARSVEVSPRHLSLLLRHGCNIAFAKYKSREGRR